MTLSDMSGPFKSVNLTAFKWEIIKLDMDNGVC